MTLEFRSPLLVETDLWRRAELIELPEWGGVRLEVRSMTAGDRLNFFATTVLYERVYGDKATDWGAIIPASVIPSTFAPAFDETGMWLPGKSTSRVFRWSDWDTIGDRSAGVLFKLHEAAMRLSGFDKSDLNESYLRLVSDGDFRLLFELAWKFGCTLTEMAARLPAWEMSWWRSYITLTNTEQRQANAGSSKSLDMTSFGGSFGA